MLDVFMGVGVCGGVGDGLLKGGGTGEETVGIFWWSTENGRLAGLGETPGGAEG